MRYLFGLAIVCSTAGLCSAASAPQPPQRGEEVQATSNQLGSYGGSLVVAQRSEPKTLNPVTAADAPSREVIGRMMADLIHINRASQQTEPALAKSWTESKDGRVFTLKLRRGVRFSDGQPFEADDVVFSFRVYLDEKMHSPQRDLLVIGGKPITVQKLISTPFGSRWRNPTQLPSESLTAAMLPRHLLEKPYRDGTFCASVDARRLPPAQIAGLGPFRLKEYIPGQRLILERNPYYWKVDRTKRRLPYLDQLVFLFCGQRRCAGAALPSRRYRLISRVGADNYSLLVERRVCSRIPAF